MRYRLIALDLDGTLLNSRKQITPRTREALRAVRERGIVTAVATGRASHSALSWSGQIGGGPVICANGAALFDATGQLIYTRALPVGPLSEALRIGKASGLLLECYTPDQIVIDRPFGQMRAFLSWVRPSLSLPEALAGLYRIWRVNRIRPVRDLIKWAAKPGAAPVLKLMVLGESAALRTYADQITGSGPGLEITSSAPDNLEVTASRVSKALGLEHLAARLQIPREAILAFGDSGNDLAMIRYAGLGVAMGNATDELKAAAGRQTGSCDQDGVAQAIEELCL